MAVMIPEPMQDEIPSKKWSLTRLGEYCLERGRRNAVEVWRLGRALLLAREKCPNRCWEKWRKAHCPGIGEATLQRYEKFANPERGGAASEEQLGNMTIMEALRHFNCGVSRKIIKPEWTPEDEKDAKAKPEPVGRGVAQRAIPAGSPEELSKMLKEAIQNCNDKDIAEDYKNAVKDDLIALCKLLKLG